MIVCPACATAPDRPGTLSHQLSCACRRFWVHGDATFVNAAFYREPSHGFLRCGSCAYLQMAPWGVRFARESPSGKVRRTDGLPDTVHRTAGKSVRLLIDSVMDDLVIQVMAS